ncbi:haloacid dehalogenase-like hydrolase [Desulfosarcina sp. OttesenSCG-928-B08]|nr:haloacid dehalogenase-like hydrolase [Desulfosarcina sp. OttesenSCG-928-B08]
MAAKLTPMAIAYDFDGTLSPGNMQEYDFIPALKMKPSEFWKEAKRIAKEHDADEILAYMQCMLDQASRARIPVRKKDFSDFGKQISLFPGVEEWFDRIKEYGRAQDVKVEHFLISSGLREMVQGTKIARKFKEIYASGFMYDQNQVAHWPALAVNYTTKTQYLFRINKGSFDVYDNTKINKYTPQEKRYVPFSNMVFIGDGETDIPCMRLVKAQGGHSIAVYSPNKKGAKAKAEQLHKEGRASLIAPADYSVDSAMDKAVKAVVDIISANYRLAKSGK